MSHYLQKTQGSSRVLSELGVHTHRKDWLHLEIKPRGTTTPAAMYAMRRKQVEQLRDELAGWLEKGDDE